MTTLGSSFMSTARMLAQDSTQDMSALVPAALFSGQRSRPRDPLDDLVDKARPVASRSVDGLQLAAYLESDGVTDRGAQVHYGFADVFALAEEVLRRTGPPPVSPLARLSRQWLADLRDVGHGLLYLLPAALFPAALAVLGPQSLVLGLVLAGGVGWVWAGAATWPAYRLLGHGQPASAARVLRCSAIAGLPVAALAGLIVVWTTHAGYGLVAMAVAQMAYQMASTILVFYRHEDWLFYSMVPGILPALGYLLLDPELLLLALAAGGGSVAVTYGLAVWLTGVQRGGAASHIREGLRGGFREFPFVVLYAALSAAFLLHAQAPYMLGRADVAIAMVPLIVGMGVVEWRARRFTEQARTLLTHLRSPRVFIVRIWLLLGREVVGCIATVAILGTVLLAALRSADALSPPAVVMTAAGVMLGGAYFVGFLLANMAGYRWLCGSLALCLAVHVAVVVLAPRTLSPLADTSVFLGSTVLLFLLFVTALIGRLGQAREHR